MANAGGVPTATGRWWSGRWKPFALRVAFGLLVIVVTSPVGMLIYGAFHKMPPLLRDIFGDAHFDPNHSQVGDTGVWLVLVGGAYWFWIWNLSRGPVVKKFALKVIAPVMLEDRISNMGKGGSARFAGLLDEWSHEYAPGSVWLGRSLYDDSVIGLDDDRGLLTIAASRSGKGRAAIIPNLISWPGSAVVIDPKGTNAAVTAARRGKGGGRVTQSLGQAVHVLDPFGVVPGVPSAAFNPLAEVDLTGDRAKEDIGLIADALVVPGRASDSYWDQGARSILAGIIAHLLSEAAKAPGPALWVPGKKPPAPAVPTLVDVRAALLQDPAGLDALFGAMLNNPVAGGLAKAAAAQINAAGPNERGSLFNSALQNTSWLDSSAMAKVLGRSDFQMADIKAAPTTVYVVLPPEYLQEHARFLRLFVNMTVLAASRGGKSRVPVLLIMDEFFSLGTLAMLSRASGLLSGYGLKLWPILQNLSQLKELYPENWQTFFANAGAVQIFGVNDRGTAQEIVATLGQAAREEKVDARTVRVVSNLIEAPELEQLTERETGLQVVLRSGKSPLLLKKTNYDTDPALNRTMYAPDPDHPGS